jgi:hypothetical protein
VAKSPVDRYTLADYRIFPAAWGCADSTWALAPKAVATAAINTNGVSCSNRLAVLAAPRLRKHGPPGLIATRHAPIRVGFISQSARFTTSNPSQSRACSRGSQGIRATGAVLVLGGVSVSAELWALALVSVSVLLWLWA